jgi:carboxymethylenebutenolidase
MSEVDLTTIDVPGRSATLRGYLAVPDPQAHPGPWPGVVVVFEAFGLDVEMRRHADRLAAMGYLALVPDLYSDGGARRCVIATFRALFAGEGRPFADLEAARRWLTKDERCTGTVGVIGFCLGAGFALLAASRGFDAASVNYGMAPKDLDAAVFGACPIVAGYGGRDAGLRGVASRLEAALSRAGVAHDVVQYPQAGHSFLNQAPNGPALMRPLFRLAHAGPYPPASEHAWARIEAFFAAHLR